MTKKELEELAQNTEVYRELNEVSKGKSQYKETEKALEYWKLSGFNLSTCYNLLVDFNNRTSVPLSSSELSTIWNKIFIKTRKKKQCYQKCKKS